MAQITDYDSLKTEVASWLHRDDLTDEIPGFIQLAENRLYRGLRVRQMEAALSGTISAGALAIPSGYIELKNAYIEASSVQRLVKKDVEWIYANYPTRSAAGLPKFIAREAGNFIFGPYPDGSYTVKGIYYRKLPALSVSNTNNWLTDDVPDLILFASLCEAAPWIADDARIQLWEAKLSQIATRVQEQDDNEEFSGSPLQITPR